MASQITATLPTLNFPREVDYPTQDDWAAFSAAAELNFGILGGSWSTQMQNWKDQANDMSIELNTNATIAQGLANYQGDWVSQGYTLGQTVSVSGVYYICKLTHATGQNPTTGGSIYWNLAIGNWNLKVALADFTGANVNLTNHGYQKLPSGLIIQWGVTPLSDAWGNATLIFPIAFPNSCLGLSITGNLASIGPTGNEPFVSSNAGWTNSSTTVSSILTNGNGALEKQAYVIAVGF